MADSIRLLSVLFLILATAFFVAAEFAFVKVRTSRIDQLVCEGNKKAFNVQKVINDLDGYLSACQVGITITALALGWLGEPTIESLTRPIFEKMSLPEALAHTISFAAAFFIVTFVHVVFGEMAPKTISIQKAEAVSMHLAKPMILFYKGMYPLIWLLNRSANGFVRLIGFKTAAEHEDTHSEEEIKLIVSSSSDINADEKKMLEKIFDFDETIAREIMVHRKDMVCVYLSDSMEENLQVIKESRHSRFPVCGEDRDDIKGYINIKDMYSHPSELKSLEELMRKIPKVHESAPIKKVLKKLQKEKHQIAIVFDEYGGVSGLITMEDIIEEIVGDIQDEFDDDEPSIKKAGRSAIVEGNVHIDDIKNELGIELEHSDGIDTIGGYVLTKIEEHPPKKGMCIDLEAFVLTIVETENERITSIRIDPKDK